jgi:ActR/RegA family two-component response regulator
VQNDKPKILFLDDEENIRLMLGMYLQEQDFSVTTAGTVPEALKLITQQTFDVLIADLNVGHPGDGFTVVSAMRRTQPRAVTFILTGYPAFETALEAIRLQVDDYLTKPTDTDSLAQKIRSRLSDPKVEHRIQPKRLTEIVSEHRKAITSEWLKLATDDLELGAIEISETERTDHVPRVLDVALKICLGEELGAADRTAARDHGIARRKQGYTIPLLIRETRLLETVLYRCVQKNLLAVMISHLLTDLISVEQTLQILLEESASAFLEGKSTREIRPTRASGKS